MIKHSLSVLMFTALSTTAIAEPYYWDGSRIDFSDNKVTYHNDLSYGPQDFNQVLTSDGLTVTVIILQEPGNNPDTMHVTPPEGYIAIPESVTVEEKAIGEILIVPEGMS